MPRTAVRQGRKRARRRRARLRPWREVAGSGADRVGTSREVGSGWWWWGKSWGLSGVLRCRWKVLGGACNFFGGPWKGCDGLPRGVQGPPRTVQRRRRTPNGPPEIVQGFARPAKRCPLVSKRFHGPPETFQGFPWASERFLTAYQDFQRRLRTPTPRPPKSSGFGSACQALYKGFQSLQCPPQDLPKTSKRLPGASKRDAKFGRAWPELDCTPPMYGPFRRILAPCGLIWPVVGDMWLEFNQV